VRTLTALVTAALVASACTRAVAAAPGFSDTICPEAVPYVIAVGNLRKDDMPQRVYDAVQAAADAYERCSREKIFSNVREAQNYADTRAAGFAVAAARALVALNRTDDARRELTHWRPLVQQVVDWQSDPQMINQPRPNGAEVSNTTGSAPPGDHRRSLYYDAAKQVVAAIDAELARIGGTEQKPKT
jgi:hypothetical protein